MFWLSGPTLEQVVRQYQTIVGRPAMPPAWALGFHQSRWGYDSVDALEAVVHGYEDAEIPMDTIWSDIDHMDGFRDFTLQPERYAAPRMAAFQEQLQADGRRWVPIVDPGIKVDPGYPAYDEVRVLCHAPSRFSLLRELMCYASPFVSMHVNTVQRAAFSMSHTLWQPGSACCWMKHCG